jgi:hypothetical protein
MGLRMSKRSSLSVADQHKLAQVIASVFVSNSQRSIWVAHDSSKWDFGQTGTPLDCEDTAKYQSKNIRERFTSTELIACCESLGIRPFEEDFYAERAMLLEGWNT